MPLAGKKRLLWTLAGAVFLAATLLMALPFVASTRIVTDRIAGELSAISGYQVHLGAPPEIDVWPSFQARLRQVVMEPSGDPPGAPRLEAEEIVAGLDAWSALRGEVRFRAMTITRPALRFADMWSAATWSLPPSARLGRAVRTARAILAQAPDKQSADLPDDAALGNVVIENGRVDFGNDETASITSIDATLAWPRLLQPLRFSGLAIWHGEPAEFALKADSGLALLSGGRSLIETSIKSKLATIRFDGTLEAAIPLLIEGKAHVASPSMKRAFEWAGNLTSPLMPIGDFSLDAALTGSGGRVKLDDVRIAIEGQAGTGALEIGLDQPEQAISGTLAFETLDLTPLVPAATAPTLQAAGNMPAVEHALVGPFALDLRLSADSARLGPIELAKAAATLNVRPEISAFDLSDASALGGNVQAGFRASRQDGVAEISLRAVDIDTGLLADAVGVTKRKPSGKATINAMIKGPDVDWRRLLASGNGTVSIKLADGAINDIDHAAFIAHAHAGGFFGLDEVAGGPLRIKEGEIRASLAAGIAKIEKCEFRTADTTVAISGIIPLPDKGLALSGRMTPASESEAAPLDFFVGGSWTSPFFYSLSGTPSKQ